MKKLLCICLLALVLCGLGLSAAAEGEPQAILASSQNVLPERNLAVSVTLSDCGIVNGYRVELIYDKTVFTLNGGKWNQSGVPLDTAADVQEYLLDEACEPGNSPVMTFLLKTSKDAQLDLVCEVTCNITLLTDAGEIPVTVKPVQVKINCPHTYTHNPLQEYLKSPATCLEPAIYYQSCSKCGYKSEDESRTFIFGDALGHNFKDREITSYIAQPGDCQKRNIYYVSCVACGLKGDQTFEGRTFGDHVYDFECDKKCNICYSERIAECKPGDVLSCDEKGHWYTCTLCEGKVNGERHVPGPEATPEEPQLCTVCGFVLAVHQDHTHDFSGAWDSDEQNHWQKCLCGQVTEGEAHRWDTSDETMHVCVDCGRTKEVAVAEPEPTQPTQKPTEPEPAKQSDLGIIALCALLILSLCGNVALMAVLISKNRKK